jgi:hypothetical protein
VCSNASLLQNQGLNSSTFHVGHEVGQMSLNCFVFEHSSFSLSVSFHGCPMLVYLRPTLFNFSIWECRLNNTYSTQHTVDIERKEYDRTQSLEINENSAHILLLSAFICSAFLLLHLFSTKELQKQGGKFVSNRVTYVTVALSTRYIQFPVFSHFSSLLLLVPTSGNRGVTRRISPVPNSPIFSSHCTAMGHD